MYLRRHHLRYSIELGIENLILLLWPKSTEIRMSALRGFFLDFPGKREWKGHRLRKGAIQTYNSFLHKHRNISANTSIHTTTMHPANTHPNNCRPWLSNAVPSASVAVTYFRHPTQSTSSTSSPTIPNATTDRTQTHQRRVRKHKREPRHLEAQLALALGPQVLPQGAD